MLTALLNAWLFLGIALCWLFIPPLLWREQIAWRWLAGCLLALSVVQLPLWLGLNAVVVPSMLPVQHMAFYAVAPLLFLCVQQMLGVVTRAHWHLAPVMVLGVLSVSSVWWWPTASQQLQRGVYVLCFGTGSVYMGAILRRLQLLARPASLVRLEANLLRVVIATGMGAAGVALIGLFFNSLLFQQLLGSAITGVLVLAYWIQQQHPQLADAVADELADAVAAIPASDRRSPLVNLDIEATIRRLQQAMQEQKVYQQEGLDLASLAAMVQASPHQLSALLNEHMGLGFARYVKQYRVAAACRLLISKPSLSVLEVGLACGFNSLSAFYAAFREIEGMAPGRYRQAQRRILQ